MLSDCAAIVFHSASIKKKIGRNLSFFLANHWSMLSPAVISRMVALCRCDSVGWLHEPYFCADDVHWPTVYRAC